MFNQYPYLNLNDLNLDYLLNEIKKMYNEVTNFVSINAIKYADPIQWNIVNQYEKNTVVIDPLTGTAYISVAPVPSGVALTRTEYWTVVFDLGSFVTRAAQNFTSRWESETTTTATFATNTGEWLVWGDVLYKAIANIIVGDQYVVGSNIEHFTIEDLYNAYLNTIANILAMVGDLDDLRTTDKSNIVSAINELALHLNNANFYNVKDYGAVGDNTADDTSAINDAINALNLTGGILFFPRGAYKVTAPLNTISKIGSVVMGISSSLNANISSGDILISFSAIQCRVANMQFTAVNNVGVAIQTTAQCIIEGCTFYEFETDIAIHNSTFVTIRDNYFLNDNGDSITIDNTAYDSGDHRIYGNTWDSSHSSTDYGCAIHFRSGGGMQIFDNKFLHVTHALQLTTEIGATSVLVFEGNSIEGLSSHAILFDSTLTGVPFRNVVISANEFSSGSGFVKIGDTSTDIAITNNHIQVSGTVNAIILEGGTNVLVENNNFIGAYSCLSINAFTSGLVYRNNKYKSCTRFMFKNYSGSITNANNIINITIPLDVGTLTQAKRVLQLNLANESTYKLSVKLNGSTPDYIERILTTLNSTVTTTQIVTSINSMLNLVVGALDTYLTVQPITNGYVELNFEGVPNSIFTI